MSDLSTEPTLFSNCWINLHPAGLAAYIEFKNSTALPNCLLDITHFDLKNFQKLFTHLYPHKNWKPKPYLYLSINLPHSLCMIWLMGKSLQSAARLHEISRVLSSAKLHRPNRLPNRVATPSTATHQQSRSQLKMESSEGERSRIPLARVVADCAKRWFKDTLKEAKAGDTNMQLLVGQMYNSGYGVPRNPEMVSF